jgi:F-type H+-transporting ATPase subunit delta
MAQRATVASARRYAEAVFDLALEDDALSAWSDDLDTVVGFVSEPDVTAALANNRVPREEKLRLLSAGLERDVSPQAWNLVRLLEDRGRIDAISDVQRIFLQKLDDHLGRARATVTTAVPLAEDEQRAIAARLSQITGKQVEVRPVVDESIIGGVVARIGDQLIDGSTCTRLIDLKRRLSGAAR